MKAQRVHNKTAREWLIQFASTYRRQHRVDGHTALEATFDESRAAAEGSLLKFAASAYSGIGDNQRALERLIAAVERAAPLRHPYTPVGGSNAGSTT
jgi:hypothetical protein